MHVTRAFLHLGEPVESAFETDRCSRLVTSALVAAVWLKPRTLAADSIGINSGEADPRLAEATTGWERSFGGRPAADGFQPEATVAQSRLSGCPLASLFVSENSPTSVALSRGGLSSLGLCLTILWQNRFGLL